MQQCGIANSRFADKVASWHKLKESNWFCFENIKGKNNIKQTIAVYSVTLSTNYNNYKMRGFWDVKKRFRNDCDTDYEGNRAKLDDTSTTLMTTKVATDFYLITNCSDSIDDDKKNNEYRYDCCFKRHFT